MDVATAPAAAMHAVVRRSRRWAVELGVFIGFSDQWLMSFGGTPCGRADLVTSVEGSRPENFGRVPMRGDRRHWADHDDVSWLCLPGWLWSCGTTYRADPDRAGVPWRWAIARPASSVGEADGGPASGRRLCDCRSRRGPPRPAPGLGRSGRRPGADRTTSTGIAWSPWAARCPQRHPGRPSRA
jgi:hypothetical protein